MVAKVSLPRHFIDAFDPKAGNLPVFQKRIKPNRGIALVVGSKIHEGTLKPDRRKLFDRAVGIDLEEGQGVDMIHDITRSPVISGDGWSQFDHIDCVSMLEHCDNPFKAAINIQRNMKKGATILVCAPFVWRVHAYPDDYFRYTVSGIRALFKHVQWTETAYMCHGVEVPKTPVLSTKYGDFYAKTEVLCFGVKR